MKKILFLIIIIPVLSLSQTNSDKVEYYKNGTIKYSHKTLKNGIIINEFYRTGELKYYENTAQNNVKKYYKSGQLSYNKSLENNIKKELFYDRNGEIIMQMTDDIIDFNIYENRNITKHDHDHSHDHSHDNHHHH